VLYDVLAQVGVTTFVPYPTESKNAYLPLLQQISACIAALLLLFLGNVHEMPAHLFMLYQVCCCSCWLCSCPNSSNTVLCKCLDLPGQQHIQQQTADYSSVKDVVTCCGLGFSNAHFAGQDSSSMSLVVLQCCW
jgi:hypothetical protein